MADRFDAWRDAVLEQVRFWPDRERIGQELTEHWEDHREDLLRVGYPEDEAEARTLAAMGDPAAVGKALDREHSPLLGWLWELSRWAVGIAVVLLAVDIFAIGSVFQYRDLLPPQWPQEDPAEFAQLSPAAELGEYWTFVSAGTSAVQAESAGYTLQVPQWSQWRSTDGKFARVCLVLTVEPDHVWQGIETEFSDDLRFRWAGGEIANSQNRRNISGTPVPWASIGHGDLSQGLTRECYQVMMTLPSQAEWVEISYPYGDNDWVLRVELEAVT